MTSPVSPSETIAKADRCKFSTYGYACGKHVEHGRYLCEEHAKAKCASCGQPATHGCDFCGQFVCGTPLCDECTFGTDSSKPAGAWGFINHIHVSKPEFADKHENRRLKEENAALALQLEAMQREMAEKDTEIARLRGLMRDNGTPKFNAVCERAENAEACLRDFVEAHKTGAGLLDCMDNAGKRYTSRFLAETIARARTLIQGEKK